MDKELARGESAVDNIERRLSGGRERSSNVPCGRVLGLSQCAFPFLALVELCLEYVYSRRVTVSAGAGQPRKEEQRAARSGRALTLPKADVRQTFQPANGRHLLG